MCTFHTYATYRTCTGTWSPIHLLLHSSPLVLRDAGSVFPVLPPDKEISSLSSDSFLAFSTSHFSAKEHTDREGESREGEIYLLCGRTNEIPVTGAAAYSWQATTSPSVVLPSFLLPRQRTRTLFHQPQLFIPVFRHCSCFHCSQPAASLFALLTRLALWTTAPNHTQSIARRSSSEIIS